MEFENLVKQFTQSGTSTDMKACLSHLMNQQCYNLAIFFYEMCADVYNYDRELLSAGMTCYLKLGHRRHAWKIATDLLSSSTLTRDEVVRYTDAASQCVPTESIPYPEEKVTLVSSAVPVLPIVTFTITTCKRYDLFERTMNSFLHHCTDTHLIAAWICVDDNSAPADRELMKQKYPFFTFVWKTPDQKGHAQSMNILMDRIETPFVFHMEDDWEFFRTGAYIQDCLEVLHANASFGQCLLNRNYMELPTDRIDGGVYNKTENGLIYFTHEYQENATLFASKHGSVPNCAYWPHYSLRPGVSRVSALRATGRYAPSAHHFEMEFSYRYAARGFKTAFLDWVYCRHTGRLTRDRFDMTKKNAYTLNNEAQFGSTPVVSSPYEAYVINLDRRSDRMVAFTQACPPSLGVRRVSAIDGSKLAATRSLEQLFEKNDYNYRRGMVGCALTHLQLWIQCAKGTETYLILEDDVTFVPDFDIKLDYIMTQLPETWGVVFLGHHVYDKHISETTFDKYQLPTIEAWSVSTSLNQSRGGTGGYLLHPSGAAELLKYIQSSSMTNGIDTMMQKAPRTTVPTYYASPHLVYSDCYTLQHQDVDTDIQRDYDSLRRTDDDMVRDELRYFAEHRIDVNAHDGTVADDAVSVHTDACTLLDVHDCFTYTIGSRYHVHVPSSVHLPSFRLRYGKEMTLDHIARYA